MHQGKQLKHVEHFSLLLINAKLLVRDLWKDDLNWDEITVQNKQTAGKTHRKTFNLSAIRIYQDLQEMNDQWQMLCFSGASGKEFKTCGAFAISV